MAYNVREMLSEFSSGLKEVGKSNPREIHAFMNMLGTTYRPKHLDTKTKGLISVAIAAYTRCEYSIVFQVYKALEAGVTRDKILEAALVAVCFGGGPSLAGIVTLLKECLDEFEGDFKEQVFTADAISNN